MVLLSGCASSAEMSRDESGASTSEPAETATASPSPPGSTPASEGAPTPDGENGDVPKSPGEKKGEVPINPGDKKGDKPDSPSVGSPLRIPLPTDELSGRNFASGEADLKIGIAFACGGTQCVSVKKVGESTQLAAGEECDKVRRVDGFLKDPDPPYAPYVIVASGGTISVVVNVRCEDLPSPPSVGSPLRIPLPTDALSGRNYAKGLTDLQAEIAEACGGTQCVAVKKTGASTQLEAGETCDTISGVEGVLADPETGVPFVTAVSGGTVTVVVNVRCEDVPTSSPPHDESPVRTELSPADDRLRLSSRV